MSMPVQLTGWEFLIKSMRTYLSSKVVSRYSSLLAPLAIDVVLNAIRLGKACFIDSRDIRIVKKLGGTINDMEMV